MAAGPTNHLVCMKSERMENPLQLIFGFVRLPARRFRRGGA